ncbi:MAG: chemotaxis protein CheD [Promethearchaeota archaeon]
MLSSVSTQKKSERITIGISEMSIGKNDTLLITVGLGSCIGIALWDSVTKIGGLSHIMLPDSKSIHSRQKFNPGKFGDTAIPLLVDYMVKAGAVQNRIVAKIAGGAQMFNFSRFDVGGRNAAAVKKKLKEMKIHLKSEDILGNKGRTILFNCETGTLIVKKIGEDMKKI